MAKSHTVYVCQNCGESQPKWAGQCPSCGQWNTLVETIAAKESGGVGKSAASAGPLAVVSFADVMSSAQPTARLSTGIHELDRVLGEDSQGSGMVPGAVILIGGEPGIGKSTLLTQMVVRLLLRKESFVGPIVYVAGEESPSQIALRVRRILSNEHKKLSNEELSHKLLFISSTNVDQLSEYILSSKPGLLIVDSIQAMVTDELAGSSGSIGQLRESTERITQAAKALGVPVFLVGHVTKEGVIAGPKVLEHIVDTVLELSGERTGQLRILRAIKNRFGATDEVGVFQVDETGLSEVSNPADLLLEQTDKIMPGSAVSCVMEGTRPLLAEVQALVVDSQLAMPRRVGRGVQLSRIQVLAAVLQKHCRLPLGTTDIFVNVAGGFSITEPAVDLGVAVAIASSWKNLPLPEKTVFIGEVGLLGEIRKVNYLQRRIKEAKRLGFVNIYSVESFKTLGQLLKKLGIAP